MALLAFRRYRAASISAHALEQQTLMKRLTSIVAVNHAGAIGARNALPWRLRDDLRFFREATTGQVVMMGRLTYDSLGSHGLPNRQNVVLSHQFGLVAGDPSCTPATGIAEGLAIASRLAGSDLETFVIGGASMYGQLAPYVDRYIITMVEKDVPDADVFFKKEEILGDPDEWELRVLMRHDADERNEAPFCIFELISKRATGIASARAEVIARQPKPLGGNSRRASRQTRGGSEAFALAL